LLHQQLWARPSRCVLRGTAPKTIQYIDSEVLNTVARCFDSLDDIARVPIGAVLDRLERGNCPLYIDKSYDSTQKFSAGNFKIAQKVLTLLRYQMLPSTGEGYFFVLWPGVFCPMQNLVAFGILLNFAHSANAGLYD
jgi:hypothetical protein